MRMAVVASGIVAVFLGSILVALYFLTENIQRFAGMLQFSLIAGSLIAAGLVLLVVGLVAGSGSRTIVVPGSQGASTLKCPKCGGQLPSVRGKTRCPYCGRKVVPVAVGGVVQPAVGDHRFCISCGAPLHPLSSFCQRCGRELRT